jgi:hypothetical protein
MICCAAADGVTNCIGAGVVVLPVTLLGAVIVDSSSGVVVVV